MSLLTDIRQATRSLLRSPGFSGVAILTLALAIGANTAIYSALRTLVLDPLPFADADRFVYLWHKNPALSGLMVTPPRKAIEQWRAASHVFSAVESFTSKSLVLTGGSEPEEIKASVIRPTLLPMLGVTPRIGHGITDADTQQGAPRVALLSDALWKRRYGGDARVIGQTITLSDHPYTVAGVMAPDFELPSSTSSAELWIGAQTDDAGETGQNTIAKLAPGVTPEEAQRELDRLGKANAGDSDLAGWSGHIMLPGDRTGVGSALFVMAGAVGLLLLIACVNVANLMLSRNSGRQRELAVRHALGASHGRLVRYLLAESLTVAIAGGLAGLLLAQWMLAAMTALRPRQLDALAHVRIDNPVLAFALVVSVVTGLLFGLLPALRASRVNLQDVLRTGGRSATVSNHRLRQVLTTAQVAIALILLVGASLLLRSFARLTTVDTGINPDGVLAMRVVPPASRYKTKELRDAFYDELLASVSALPGVTSAAIGNGMPPETGIMFGSLEIADRPSSKPAPQTLYSGGYISPAYFSTLRIPVMSGRGFTPGDIDGSDPVVVVGRSLAEKYWPGRSPLGSQLRLDAKATMATVIGVVGDVKANDVGHGGLGDLQLYFPRAQAKPGFGVVIVRAGGDPAALIPALKAQVWALDSHLPIQEIMTGRDLVKRVTSRQRFNLALIVTFALSGLTLAAVGVYGVMALYVGQRQREMGLRIALGATPSRVAALIMRQTSIVLGLGVVLGALGSLALTKFIASMLFDTRPTDATSFGLAILAIVSSALMATLAPLYRAIHVDPAVALRGE